MHLQLWPVAELEREAYLKKHFGILLGIFQGAYPKSP